MKVLYLLLQERINMAFEEVSNYINQVRRDFAQKSLDQSDVAKNPIEQLSNWIEEAINAQILDPYAMMVSTVNADGEPHSRIVYLREIIENGLVFYTNYNSQKGHDLEANPKVSINFFWVEVERQVRIEGEVTKHAPEASDAYFSQRPRESQLGAWASDQSSEIETRADLEQRLHDMEKRFEGEEVPRPPHWGGYVVKPTYFEFWQGRPSRLHDRVFYRWENKQWEIGRLMP